MKLPLLNYHIVKSSTLDSLNQQIKDMKTSRIIQTQILSNQLKELSTLRVRLARYE